MKQNKNTKKPNLNLITMRPLFFTVQNTYVMPQIETTQKNKSSTYLPPLKIQQCVPSLIY